MTNTIGNAPPPQQSFFSRVGAAISAGLSAIGNKLAEFGHAVANFFRSLGGGAANAVAHAHPAGASAPVLPGSTFTNVEKQQHMDSTRNGTFYQSLAGSTDPQFNQASYDGIARAVLNTPASVAGMKAYGVSLDEAVAISYYTSQNYRDINDALRNNTGNPIMTALAQAFTDGLAKLPSFDGNPVVTPQGTFYQAFRGAKLPDNVGPNYQIGANIADAGIMSSTYDRGQAFRDINYSITLLLKPGSEGKDISMFSDKPDESEVAFPPNVNFTVTSRFIDSGGLLPPHMEATYHPAVNSGSVCELVMTEV